MKVIWVDIQVYSQLLWVCDHYLGGYKGALSCYGYVTIMCVNIQVHSQLLWVCDHYLGGYKGALSAVMGM